MRSDGFSRPRCRPPTSLADCAADCQQSSLAVPGCPYLWLAVIFASFGLFAPRNTIVLAALFVAALSVAGSIFLILEMDQPYGGFIKIRSDPLRSALEQLGRP